MTARPDPASFDLSLARTVGGTGALPVPAGKTATVARKIGVLALLVGGFLMVPSIQARGFAEQAQAAPSGPALYAADFAARQQAALLTSQP